jgi:hypothetical protein
MKELSTQIKLSLPDEMQAMSNLPDEEVAALTDLRMEPEADRRLSALLSRQQADQLPDLERAELAALMREYEVALVRESQAMAEAVRRGLRPPLSP